MKRLSLILAAVFAAVITLSSCSGESLKELTVGDIYGIWEYTTADGGK